MDKSKKKCIKNRTRRKWVQRISRMRGKRTVQKYLKYCLVQLLDMGLLFIWYSIDVNTEMKHKTKPVTL